MAGALRSKCLAAEAESSDERTVTRDVDVGEVAEQTTTLTHKQQETTTRVVVVLVLLEVLGELLDSRGEDGNLNFRGASITRVRCVLFDDGLLAFSA